MWTGTDADELVAVWSEELARYTLDEMRRALEALRYSNPTWPPTAYEFANLCKEAARSRARYDVPRIESSRTDGPDPQVLAAIHALTERMRDPNAKRDRKDWARRILRDEADGVKLPEISRRYAKEALGCDA